jgi:hypothetical protein
MSCKNPNTEISAEISKTLEILGPKFQNAWNFTLRVSGGALEEAVLSYAKIIPNVQVLRAENISERRVIRIFWKHLEGRTVLQEREETGRCLCNGFFKTYALIPC